MSIESFLALLVLPFILAWLLGLVSAVILVLPLFLVGWVVVKFLRITSKWRSDT